MEEGEKMARNGYRKQDHIRADSVKKGIKRENCVGKKREEEKEKKKIKGMLTSRRERRDEVKRNGDKDEDGK